MSRRYRPRKKHLEVELFPFLSILACTIGTLVLLIIVLTTQTIGEQPQVTIVARNEGGGNREKIPRYIECREEGVVIYPNQEFVPISELRLSRSAFQQLLQQVRQRPNEEYLIVAIRPNGFEVFQEVRELTENLGIDIGYEPLDEGWKLNVEELGEI